MKEEEKTINLDRVGNLRRINEFIRDCDFLGSYHIGKNSVKADINNGYSSSLNIDQMRVLVDFDLFYGIDLDYESLEIKVCFIIYPNANI